MSELLGAINGYQCETCGWCCQTINLNHGTTPMSIGCLGDQKNNVNAPENIVIGGQHIVFSNGYKPQKWWFTRKSPHFRIEYGWIRPTPEWFLKWILEQDVPEGEDPMDLIGPCLDHIIVGGLQIVRLDEEWENMPIRPDYHKDSKKTLEYLTDTYRSLIRKAEEHYGSK